MTSNPSFKWDTTAEEAAEAFSGEIRGRNIVITGVGLRGIGEATALAIAGQSPGLLVVTGRSMDKVNQSIAAIKAVHPTANIRALHLDLSSQKSVKEAAKEVTAYPESKIDVVINNAGVMNIKKLTKSEDGIEMQFATNHIGHFLFTNLIMDKILAAAPGARVVNVSSNGHEIVGNGVRFDDINFDDGSYTGFDAYGQSKTANVLYSIELAERLGEKGVYSHSLHPGAIMSELGRHTEPAFWQSEQLKNLQWKTQSQGSSTTLVAAFDPALKDHNGIYLYDCQPRQTAKWVTKENAKKLWTLSEKLVGEKFNF